MNENQSNSVAIYRRRIRASLERVWENVRDWEHLPWLHREAFARIELLEAGSWGWRARIGLHGDPSPEIEVALRIESDAQRYVARTESGPGIGTEIWTQLQAAGADATDIEVNFCIPGVAPAERDAVGRGYTALYTQLWDQDEAMMIRRAELLGRRPKPGAAEIDFIELGDRDALLRRLPLCVEAFGRRVRILDCAGTLVAHDTVCPHMLGPLEDARVENGAVVCPWHGYRFDLASGCETSGGRLRMFPAPRVEIDGRSNRVRLVRGPAASTR